jgi:hypothetical protein
VTASIPDYPDLVAVTFSSPSAKKYVDLYEKTILRAGQVAMA